MGLFDRLTKRILFALVLISIALPCALAEEEQSQPVWNSVRGWLNQAAQDI